MILYIIGAGGHGKVAAEIAILMNSYKEIVFLDENKNTGSQVLGLQVIGKINFNFIKNLVNSKANFFVAIGDSFKRAEIQNKLFECKANITTLIHPNANISKFSCIGEGSIVCAGATLGPDVKIGKGSIINHSSTVDHDSNVGNFVHICPHASLSGNTQVGDSSTLGTGARVIPSITIGENCLIGAGAVVTRSIPNFKKAYGVPAKIVN